MRGIKKLYKPDRLKRLIAPDDRFIPSHQPAYQLDEIELERWEVDILPHINGIHTVTELLRKVQKPEHVVYGTLWALTALSILERRS
ncbi:MAG TPA: two-component system response regulator, partial [Myxococcaceae bacterium]|nr:two-component system response regulator [Myxococcaceae bacterium]